MDFIQNFPFFSILLSLGSGVLTSIMNKKAARLWNTFILVVITVMSAVLFVYARCRQAVHVHDGTLSGTVGK